MPCKYYYCLVFCLAKTIKLFTSCCRTFTKNGPRAGIFQVRFPFATVTNTKEIFLFKKVRKPLTKQQDHKVPFAEL